MCSKTNSQHFLPMRPTQSASIMAYTSPLFSSAADIEETEAEQPLSDNCLSGPNAECRPRWQSEFDRYLSTPVTADTDPMEWWAANHHLFPLENKRLLDRYRIGTDTGCIASNRIGYCCIGRYYVHHCRFSSSC